MRISRHILKLFILFSWMFIFSGVKAEEEKNLFETFKREPNSVTEYNLESQGYLYTYRVYYKDDSSITSTIIIKEIFSGEVKFLSSSYGISPPESCNKDIGTIKEFVGIDKRGRKSKFVVMCSGDGGLSRQVFVFKGIDFLGGFFVGRSSINLKMINENSMLLYTYEEVSLPGGGFDHLPIVKKIEFGSYPSSKATIDFSEHSEPYYRDNYKWLIEKNISKYSIRAIFASLVGINDKKYICEEYKKIMTSKILSNNEVKEILLEIGDLGYPSEAIFSCEN